MNFGKTTINATWKSLIRNRWLYSKAYHWLNYIYVILFFVKSYSTCVYTYLVCNSQFVFLRKETFLKDHVEMIRPYRTFFAHSLLGSVGFENHLQRLNNVYSKKWWSTWVRRPTYFKHRRWSARTFRYGHLVTTSCYSRSTGLFTAYE